MAGEVINITIAGIDQEVRTIETQPVSLADVSGAGPSTVYGYDAANVRRWRPDNVAEQIQYDDDVAPGDPAPGAIADGNSHLLSSVYSTLAEAQAAYPYASGLALTDQVDWAAIQNEVSSSDCAVCWLSQTGVYLVNKPITITNGQSIRGKGQRGPCYSVTNLTNTGAIIKSAITDGSPVLKVNSPDASYFRGALLENFTIVGTRQAAHGTGATVGTEGDGILIEATNTSTYALAIHIHNVGVRQCQGNGIYYHAYTCTMSAFRDIDINNCGGHGFKYLDTISQGSSAGSEFSNVKVNSCLGRGFYIENGVRLVFNACKDELSQMGGWQLKSCKYCTFISCHSEGDFSNYFTQPYVGAYLDTSLNNTFINCQLSGGTDEYGASDAALQFVSASQNTFIGAILAGITNNPGSPTQPLIRFDSSSYNNTFYRACFQSGYGTTYDNAVSDSNAGNPANMFKDTAQLVPGTAALWTSASDVPSVLTFGTKSERVLANLRMMGIVIPDSVPNITAASSIDLTNVKVARIVGTGGAVNIANMTGGKAGQIVYLFIDSGNSPNTTFVHGSSANNPRLLSGANYTPADLEVMAFISRGDGNSSWWQFNGALASGGTYVTLSSGNAVIATAKGYTFGTGTVKMVGTEASNRLQFYTNGAEAVRVGLDRLSVGAGFTENYALNVYGSIEIQSTGNLYLPTGQGLRWNNSSLDSVNCNSTTHRIDFNANNARAMQVTGTGLVIGPVNTDAATAAHLVESKTLSGALASGYAACATCDPRYSGAYTVTKHNYFHILNPTLSGGAAVTDAILYRFDAAAGTHKAVDAATTKTTPSGVDAWIKVSLNGTLGYVPVYLSKTA